jgi:NAD(P)-dependent dehydrogenase (short-subunit alcohol dehydrogenase family)
MPTALVTGANRGLGLALYRALLERDFDVIAACRTSSREFAALEATVVVGVDLAGDAGEWRLADGIADRELALVLVNAGIVRSMTLEDLDIEGIRAQFEVNALGALRTVRAVLPALLPGSKLCLISSLAASIQDNGAGGEYGYRMSKAALNMAGVSLARDLASRGGARHVDAPGTARHTDDSRGRRSEDAGERRRRRSA